MRTTVAVLATLGILAAACGRGAAPMPEAAAPADDVRRCEDLAQIELPSEHLSDEPIYVGNEQPIAELSEWAASKPGFEQAWIDRDHLGWVVLAFSQDADARQTELRERFPDVGAVVVAVDWTMAELRALQERVIDEIDSVSSVGADVTKGVVSINVGPLTEERLDEVAEHFGGERVCVEGFDPATLPAQGPQPQTGEGWRLLADQTVGEPYRTWIAADPDGYARLWSDIGLAGELPAVDFDTEVVIWFGAVYSGSCPEIRMDDVVVDHDRDLVHAEIVHLEGPGVCTSDANPRAYVVAVERSVLPAGPFAIQLHSQEPPYGAPEERTLVEADLTRPGATLSSDQVGPDPGLAEPPPRVLGPGDRVEPGFPADYRFYLHCGPEWLGPLNDVMWRSDVTATPPAWRDASDENQELIVEVFLETEPARLTATANGHQIVYDPTADEPPGCD
ncbi:MAG TPA: hypothetical protein VGA69_10410 [Nitriliruptorales bacterium]